MAITVTYLGAADVGGALTASFNPAAAVPAGDVVITPVAEWDSASPTSPPTYGDNQSNPYLPGLTAHDASTGETWGIGTMIATHALSGSDTVTITGVNSSAWMSGLGVHAAGASSSYYASATAVAATTTTPSISTSASVNAGDLVIAVAFNRNVTPTAPGGAWNTLHTYAAIGAIFSYQIAAGSGVLTYSPTSGTNQSWGLAIAAFPAAQTSSDMPSGRLALAGSTAEAYTLAAMFGAHVRLL